MIDKTDKIGRMLLRRHPLYEAMLPHWNFIESTYEGGRAWFKDNIFRYMKEGESEYADRVNRAYRFNHTRQVVDLVDKYLFKQDIHRRTDDASQPLVDFWENATLAGLSMDHFARRISNNTSKFGRIWVVVDNTMSSAADGAVSVAEARESGGRVYAYIVKPQDALDMSYDDAGNLTWILFRELARDDEDPVESTGEYLERYRLWTQNEWVLYGEERYGRHNRLRRYTELERGEHGLGVVPVVQVDHVFSEEPYETCGLIDDIAYLDRANANYLSNLDAIIQDQTFSQLTMPAQGVMPGEDGHQKLIEAGTKRVFTYNGEAGQKPEYISPDPRQASMILSAIGKIINEIYHSVGLSGERTKDDNGGGIDNASGVAKAYDFERVNSLLAAKAASLQLAERRIATLVSMWNGTEAPEHDCVSYPEKFDTRSLYDEFEIGARLSLLAAPDEVRRKQMQQVVDKLFPAMGKKERSELEKALSKWPLDPIEQARKMAEATTVNQPGLPGTKAAGGDKSTGSDPVKAAAMQKTAKEMTA